MDTLDRLYAALLSRGLRCDQPQIEECLALFKESFARVPNIHPGKEVIYQLYLFCLENGADIDKATKLVKQLILRNQQLMEQALNCNLCHIPVYRIEKTLVCP